MIKENAAAELRHRGVYVSRKRVARLMRWAGLSGMVRRHKGRTMIRVPGIATAPELVRRDFAPTAPNRLSDLLKRRGRSINATASGGYGGRVLSIWTSFLPERCGPSDRALMTVDTGTTSLADRRTRSDRESRRCISLRRTARCAHG
jgi:transposase InsO family protein